MAAAAGLKLQEVWVQILPYKAQDVIQGASPHLSASTTSQGCCVDRIRHRLTAIDNTAQELNVVYMALERGTEMYETEKTHTRCCNIIFFLSFFNCTLQK